MSTKAAHAAVLIAMLCVVLPGCNSLRGLFGSHLEAGKAHYRAGEISQAVAQLEAAVAELRDEAGTRERFEAYTWLGRAYRDDKRADRRLDALSSFSNAIEVLNEQRSDVYRRMRLWRSRQQPPADSDLGEMAEADRRARIEFEIAALEEEERELEALLAEVVDEVDSVSGE